MPDLQQQLVQKQTERKKSNPLEDLLHIIDNLLMGSSTDTVPQQQPTPSAPAPTPVPPETGLPDDYDPETDPLVQAALLRQRNKTIQKHVGGGLQ